MHLSLLGKAFLVAAGAYAVSKVVNPTQHVVYIQQQPTQPDLFRDLLFSLAKDGDLFGFFQAFDSHGHGDVSNSKRMAAYDDWRIYIARFT